MRPAMDLASAIKQQAQNNAAAQQGRLQEEQVNLAQEKQSFDEGQLPWAALGGALSAGVQMFGGWQALQNAREAKVRAAQNEAMQQKTLAQATAATGLLGQTVGKIRDLYNKSPQTPTPQAAMFDWDLARRTVAAPY